MGSPPDGDMNATLGKALDRFEVQACRASMRHGIVSAPLRPLETWVCSLRSMRLLSAMAAWFCPRSLSLELKKSFNSSWISFAFSLARAKVE